MRHRCIAISLQAGNTGLQHVAYWTEDFDADLARLEGQGFKAGDERRSRRRAAASSISTREYHPGTVIELSEVAGPKGKMFDLIREAGKRLGRQRPVRPFPDLSKL